MSQPEFNAMVDELVRENHARLRAFIFSRTREYETTDEVAQEVFLVVLKQIDTYDRSQPAWPWILGIARNKLREFWRERAKRTGDSLEALIATEELRREEEGIAQALEGELEAMESCMESLSPESRRLVTMTYTGGLTSTQVAEQLGRQAGAIRVALHKIRERLSLCIRMRMEVVSG